MRQYRKIKERYPEMILLFRMGDFFETFEDDAVTTSRVLGITLTKRANGAASEVPLAGFPHHALDNYLPKLVKAGYRVAICEQLEDPKFAKGIVKRDVVEVVTPGANFSEKLLSQKSNNFLAAIYIKNEKCGFSFCDVSTGEFSTSEIHIGHLKDQIEIISPSEILIPKRGKEKIYETLDYSSHDITTSAKKYILTKVDDWIYNIDYARELLTNQFGTQSLKGFGIEDMHEGIVAAGVIMNYLNETQKNNLSHIKKITVYDYKDYIILDPATKRNLEITTSISEGGREGTLISVLDKTITAMGGRLLKKWISRPLKIKNQIEKRLQVVEFFYNNKNLRKKTAEELKSIADLERLLSKTATGKSVPRDILQLKCSLKKISEIKKLIYKNSGLLKSQTDGIPIHRDQNDKGSAHNNISERSDEKEAGNYITSGGQGEKFLKQLCESLVELPDLTNRIESVINDNYLLGKDTYGIINKGFNSELDELKDIFINGKTWIENYQSKERKRTGISSLKVDYNKIFGYYIEVTKPNLDKVPADYIRKQTLVNTERYITEELKSYEDKIFNSEERINKIENEILSELRIYILNYTEQIQKNAQITAMIDVLVSFAEISSQNKYTLPEINESDKIIIKEGRHPVIEKLLPAGEKYIPNDTESDTGKNQILILTGPNMSGKSSYLRQVGLIVLLAQIGCFIPAKKASIGIVDKVFTRVGASDNIAKGESTFLVEMHEAANILNNATTKSLILLDEIGRGTSTYDGISIAWAITEYLHENQSVRAKTLFATHYHELNSLAIKYDRIKNYRVEVREYNDKIIFLRKISEGTADHSYGIEVAKMAGLPESVTNRAKEILRHFEEKEARRRNADEFQISLFEITEDERYSRLLDEIDIDKITPIEALYKLKELKDLKN